METPESAASHDFAQTHAGGIEANFRGHTREWYALFGGKCPVCGHVPDYEIKSEESK